MKATKLSFLALAGMILGGTAQAAPYYMPSNNYTDNLPPERPTCYSDFGDSDTVSATFSLEIGGTYTNMCIHDTGTDYDLNPIGVDATAVYHLSENWAVTLRGAWNKADDKSTYEVYDKWDAEIQEWAIMPGIRYTIPVSDRIKWYVGANIGYAHAKAEESWIDTYDGEHENYKWNENGLDYSIETGVNVYITNSFYVYGAVQFWGTTIKPGDNGDYQQGIGVRVGTGVSF